jgi:transcriptional regulator with XRE-family HTH domain
MTIDGVRKLLAARIKKAGSRAAFAQEAGVSRSLITEVMQGTREPGEGILKALGLRKRPTEYERIKSP